MKKELCVLILAALLSAAPAAANQRSRPCRQADIIGTWEMRSISTKLKVDPRDPFAAPHQWFSFDSLGRFQQMTSSEPIAESDRAFEQFSKRVPTTRYTMDHKGTLTLSRIETPNPEVCICTFVLEGTPQEKLASLPAAERLKFPKEGDLVLTYLNRDGKPVLAKSLRRVKA